MKKQKFKAEEGVLVPVTNEELNKALVGNLPKWVGEVEDTGTAMMHAGQEFLLVIEDALIRYHGFDEKKLQELHKQILPVLKGVKEFEKHGLSMLSPGDVSVVGDMGEAGELGQVLGELATVRQFKLRTDRAGFEVPVLPGAQPFLKKLKEKNAK